MGGYSPIKDFGMKHLPLFVKIIIGMVLGIITGIVMININATEFANNWIKPWGEIFMRLLKLIAVPLVFISLIKGVTNLGDIRSLSTLGLRVVMLYVLTTIVAISFGVGIAYLVKPGEIISDEAAQSLKSSYDLNIATTTQPMQEALSPLEPIVNIFPENLFSALANNGSMLQIIAIAILIGIATLMVGKEHTAPFNQLVSSLEKIIIKLVDIIMIYAPIGVFSLITMAVVDSAGDLSLLSA
ncbi:MAG: cation:dicarboxylase symporter family transporter, partial [Bacteroidales bacterium]